MIDIIVALVIVAILGSAIGYIVHAKKKGVQCIGCALSGTCSGAHHESDHSGCAGGCSGCSGSCSCGDE